MLSATFRTLGLGMALLLISSIAAKPETIKKVYYPVVQTRIILDTVYVSVEAFKSKASWYGPGFHGKKTASGEKYNQEGLTAASVSLPFGTKVRVTNLDNNKSVIVTINDRGPYHCKIKSGKVVPHYPLEAHHTRKLDLSKAAMKALGGIRSGVIPIHYSIIP